MTRVLHTSGLRAGYGRIEVLHGIDLYVDAGEIVTILGTNGAGKTTTLLAIAGAIPSSGRIDLFSKAATGGVLERSIGGVAFLPDQRGVIRALTVEQNLRIADVSAADVYTISPELEVLANRRAGDLSGGEQQILALSRAIASQPKLLLADEVSFGLSPIVVRRMFQLIQRAAVGGAAVLMVEQYAHRALSIANRAYILQRGEIVMEGSAEDLLVNISALEESYLGNTS